MEVGIDKTSALLKIKVGFMTVITGYVLINIQIPIRS